jgi:tRNA pseudouridine55 synthase
VINGFFLINKNSGITSAGVVKEIKKKFNLKKVGHLGTLDPLASGLLILAVNKATKLASLLLESHKSYLAEVTLGIQTDTDDAEGKILSSMPVNCSSDAIKKELNNFLGESLQVPPVYSALKHKGRPMYKYAREGILVKKDARKINIHELKNIDIKLPKVIFDISCSKGTYIRSIARDLGLNLGCGAHLSGLVRTGQHQFLLEDSRSIEDVNIENLIVPEKIFEHLDQVYLNKIDSKDFLNGCKLQLEIKNNLLYRVYDDSRNFIAIGKKTDEGFQHEYLV